MKGKEARLSITFIVVCSFGFISAIIKMVVWCGSYGGVRAPSRGNLSRDRGYRSDPA